MTTKLNTLLDLSKRKISYGGISIGNFVQKRAKKKTGKPSIEKGIIYDVFPPIKKKDGTTVIKVKVWMESGELVSKKEFKNYVHADNYNRNTHRIDPVDVSSLAYKIVRDDGQDEEKVPDVEEEKVPDVEEEEEEEEEEADNKERWLDEFKLIEEFWLVGRNDSIAKTPQSG